MSVSIRPVQFLHPRQAVEGRFLFAQEPFRSFGFIVSTLLGSYNNLVGNANNTTSRSSTSVARLLTLCVPALAQVIRTRMNDNGSS